MKLKRATIKNFRSIKDLVIDFNIPFRILVGKNESGKSNILKALSFLDPKMQIDPADINQVIDIEESSNESHVYFEFQLNEEEINGICSELAAKLEIRGIEDLNMIKSQGRMYSLKNLCTAHSRGAYFVNFLTQKKTYNYWSVNPTSEVVLKNLMLKKQYDKSSNLTTSTVVDVSNFDDEEKKKLLPLTPNDIYELIGNEVTLLISKKHPNVIRWEYLEQDLMSDQIDIDEFLAKPEDFKALKIMFDLAGIENIKASFEKVRSTRNYHILNNYLVKVASKTTTHFRKVWNEYPDIEFTLNVNGDFIVTGIKENNTFTFKQRSDGFKRFTTFLLLVSAVYEADKLKDSILLIDEPDVSLHPSGIRFLRDELINISNLNYVVASTHSIFLIDQKNINRHYIVNKDKEVTSIVQANDENLITEEVLYNALGFSFYEILKNQNLVFEGWRDKELFKKSMERTPSEFKEIKTLLKDFGIAHINGVKEARSIAPIFELTGRKLIIISDADKVATDHKKDFEEKKCYGVWFTYEDIDQKFKSFTGEDFLKKEYIKSAFDALKKDNPTLVGEPNFDSDTPRIKLIEDWLQNNCAINDKKQRNDLLNQLKNLLFNNIKSSNIDSIYFDFLSSLSRFITTLFKS